MAPNRRSGQDMQPGEFVGVSVADSGMGIEPALLDKVFEPFFTTKPIGQGTGLGLSTIYGFVKQSGGFVKIDSSMSVWARSVEIYPAQRKADAKARRKKPSAGGVGGRQRRDGAPGGR